MLSDVNPALIDPVTKVVEGTVEPPPRHSKRIHPRAERTRYGTIRREHRKRVAIIDTEGGGGYILPMAGRPEGPTDEEALKQAMGRTIALSRVEAGFPTQAALARAIDVRFQYMSRVEKGEENLTLETLAKVTGALGVAMPEFLSRVAAEMRDPSEAPATRRGRPPNR